MSAARLIYSALYYALLPLVVARLLWRSRRDSDYRRRIGERFGWVARLQAAGRPVIWLHAVSVGETIAAAPLIEALLQRYPGHRLLVTSMTPTGSAQVRARFGDRVAHCYAPYDTPSSVARFLRRTRPRLYVIIETELWPNSVAGCRAHGIPVLLANARLSAKSARGYARFARLSGELMDGLSAVCAQTAADRERLLGLGLAARRCTVTGSIKFDLTIDDGQRQHAAALRQQWQGAVARPIWLAASTHPGEEVQLLAAFAALRRQFDNLLLVLVPRHPDRAAELDALVGAAGLAVQRHSRGGPVAPTTDVLLGDTIGELLAFYGAADIAFVGGSLIPRGGHNPIEPAAWGCPVVAGESQYNFAQASELLVAAGAMEIVSGAQLAARVGAYLVDPALRSAAGAAGRGVAERNRGALALQLTALADQLD